MAEGISFEGEAAKVEERRSELPIDVLRRAVGRVRFLCFLLGSVFALYEVLNLLVIKGIISSPRFLPEIELRAFQRGFHPIAGVAIGLSLLMYAVCRTPRFAPPRVLGLTLLYQLAGALLISMAENLTPWSPHFRGVSAVVIWIMSFPFVPTTPGRSAVAAYGAAAMGPIALGLGLVFGPHWDLDWQATFFQFLPNFLAATIAHLATLMVFRLGTDVNQARKLGSYRLVERLGQGGGGEVWRARHRTLIRPAAIKLLRPEILGGRTLKEAEALVKRFRREVQATAALQSPHTVAIYDFGTTRDGTLYYVMELLSGMDLDALVTRFGPQPPERVVHLLRQACDSLSEAHDSGLIHRDIKPANIHACVLGLEFDFVKVLDFGLVKQQDSGDPRLSVAGTVSGTPAYMSPEMAAGRDVDARADLYALGCVGYWLLTGGLVFEERTPMAMLTDHMKSKPLPPSKRTELAIPPELDEVILACLAKSPKDRPASATDLAERLASVPLAAPWTPERARKWWMTHMPEAARRVLDEPTVDETHCADVRHSIG